VVAPHSSRRYGASNAKVEVHMVKCAKVALVLFILFWFGLVARGSVILSDAMSLAGRRLLQWASK
jgi:hypothetical protein